MVSGLVEGPEDAGEDLGGANGSGEVGFAGEEVHEVAPRSWALLPGFGVFGRVDDGHDAVADENHGGEVLEALRGKEHGWLEALGDRFVATRQAGDWTEFKAA